MQPIERQTIDPILKDNAQFQSRLGIESSRVEKEIAITFWKYRLSLIRLIDAEFAETLEAND